MERLSITHGMPVVDARGHRLGVVETCGERHLFLRKGFFHRRHFAARYQDITDLNGGSVHLRGGRRDLLAADPPDGDGVRQDVLPFQRALIPQSPADDGGSGEAPAR